MKNFPILIDQDGVIADFVTGMYTELKRFCPPARFELLPKPHELEHFYIEDSINTGDPTLDAELKELINEVVDNRTHFFYRLPPIENAIFQLNRLAELASQEGIDVRICTAPHVENRTCHSDKANWAERHLSYQWAKNMIMTHDKTLVQGLVLVDDKPHVKGIMTPTWQHIVFDAPYNQASGMPRVSGWNDATVKTIMQIALERRDR